MGGARLHIADSGRQDGGVETDSLRSEEKGPLQVKVMVTGPRPHTLGTRSEEDPLAVRCIAWVRYQVEHIQTHCPEPVDEWVSGHANGVDRWFEEAVIALGLGHLLTLAIPFLGLDDRWTNEQCERAAKVREVAGFTHVVCEQASKQAYHRRNHWMLARVHSRGILLGLDGGRDTRAHATIEAAKALRPRLYGFIIGNPYRLEAS